MKQVFTAPSIVPCDFLKSLLESEGIPCVLRNEYGTNLLGYGYPVYGGSALIWAWPEVWIPEEDVEQAEPILQMFLKTYQGGSDKSEVEPRGQADDAE